MAEAFENVKAVKTLWDGLSDVFAEELAAAQEVANLASDAQKFLIKKLLEQQQKPVPDNFDKLSKTEASELIDSLGGAAKPAAQEARQAGGPAKPASEKQLGFIRTLVNRQHIDYPEGMNNMSAADASKWIDAHTSDTKKQWQR